MKRATRCPKCHTRLAVTQEQLTAHNGLVRCGKCFTIFNAAPEITIQQPVTAAVQPMPELTPPPSRIGWLVAILVLVLLGLPIGVISGRNQLAAWHPTWRPVLERLCEPLRCTVHFARNPHLLEVESSELAALPNSANQARLTVVLRNRAGYQMDYPALKLTLTDTTGKPVESRLFQPEDYLAADQVDAGMAPGSETEVHVAIALASPAQDYKVLAFYP